MGAGDGPPRRLGAISSSKPSSPSERGRRREEVRPDERFFDDGLFDEERDDRLRLELRPPSPAFIFEDEALDDGVLDDGVFDDFEDGVFDDWVLRSEPVLLEGALREEDRCGERSLPAPRPDFAEESPPRPDERFLGAVRREPLVMGIPTLDDRPIVVAEWCSVNASGARIAPALGRLRRRGRTV